MHKLPPLLLAVLLLAALLPAQTTAPKPSPGENKFDEPAASRLLLQLNEALQGHSQKKMLDLFDLAHMKEGEQFKQQVSSFFAQAESIRAHLNLAGTATENSQTTLAVDAEIEVEPSNGALPWRRQERVSFQVAGNSGQWKFIGMQPRSFFATGP